MQPHQFPSPAPATPPGVPVAVPPPPRRTHKSRWLAVGLIAAAGTGAYLWQKQTSQAERALQGAASSVRTVTVVEGSVERRLRISGSTTALRFASLIAPMLRGNRGPGGGRTGPSGSFDSGGGMRGSSGGGGRDGGSRGGGGMMASGGGRDGGGDRGNRNQDSGAGSSSSSVTGPSVASTSSAMGGTSTSTSTRASGRASTGRISSGNSRTALVDSSNVGSSVISGIGSSASTLPGQGGPGGGGGSPGGGRGGGEFGLTLQNAAKAGAFVKKGDIIAEFDRESMLMRLDDFKASVDQSEASYRRMQANMDVSRKAHEQTIRTAEGELEKAKLNLKTTAVASAMEAERLRLAHEEAEAQLKQLQGEVKYVEIGIRADEKVADLELEQTKLEYRRSETNIERMVIRAPIDGMVVMQPMIRGGELDQIKVGDQLYPGQSFMQIVDPRDMIVNAYVNQVDAEKIRIGQKARVRFDAFPDLELPAHVYSMGTVARSSRSRPDWVKEMGVVLKLDKMDPRVIPDLSVSADIVLETAAQPAPLVPRQAIFYEGSGADAKPFVYLRASNGQFERRSVALGLESNTEMAVTSGVKVGEVVAIDPPPKSSPMRI